MSVIVPQAPSAAQAIVTMMVVACPPSQDVEGCWYLSVSGCGITFRQGILGAVRASDVVCVLELKCPLPGPDRLGLFGAYGSEASVSVEHAL